MALLRNVAWKWLQEEQIVSAEGARQEGFEESANREDTRRADSELRHRAREGAKAAYDRVRAVSAESAQPDGHPESGEPVLHQVHQEQREQSAERVRRGDGATAAALHGDAGDGQD